MRWCRSMDLIPSVPPPISPWKLTAPGREGKRKAPVLLQAKAEPLAPGGVYDVCRGDGGHGYQLCSCDDCHGAERGAVPQSPVVLDDTQFDDWMRGRPGQAAEMMKPYAREIEAWDVGPNVGKWGTIGRNRWITWGCSCRSSPDN